jgi:hypothetical protein
VLTVQLPVPPSVKDKLPIPGGGFKDCHVVFYVNFPQAIYDCRAIFGIKTEHDTGKLYGYV